MSVFDLKTITTCGFSPEERRESWGSWFRTHDDRLRTMIRERLGDADRAKADTSDVLATVRRRVDYMADRLDRRPRNEQEVWEFLASMVSDFAERTRLEALRTQTELSDPALHAYLSGLLSDEDTDLYDDLNRRLRKLGRARDRELVLLRLRGCSHRAIGQVLGFSEAASRERLVQLLKKLSEFT